MPRPDPARLDRDLTRLLAGTTAGKRFGVEQEFRVTVDGSQLDFESWARLGRVPGRRLDRGDPHAHRQATGGVLTADGAEAEIATPPARLAPGFTRLVQRDLGALRHALAGSVGSAEVAGVSTHLNVEVDDRNVVRTARRFTEQHSGALMLLLDRAESPGLLLRPRRGRLELGGEYAVGHQLAAASVFAAAAAAETQLRALVPRGPLVRPRVELAHERFGWYVDRDAFGADLYTSGRNARLGRYRGQDLLDWSWERVRPHALRIASPEEVGLVEAMVTGAHRLPCEQPDPEPPTAPAATPAQDLTVDRAWHRLELCPVLLTWEYAVFRLGDGERERIVTVPATVAERFVELFGWGVLAGWAMRLLATDPAQLPVLASAEDAARRSAFSRVAGQTDLHPPEREPFTGRVGGGGGAQARSHKHDQHHGDPRGIGRALLGSKLLVGLVAALLVAGIAGTAVAVQRHRAAVTARHRADAARQLHQRIALARSFAGTYDARETVTVGSNRSPAGTSLSYPVRIQVSCTAAGACTGLEDKVSRFTLNGTHARWSFVARQPCRTGEAATPLKVVLRWDVTFSAHGFSGSKHYTVPNPSACPGVRYRPLTSKISGVER
ncbi:MAG: hypothetical protein M3130_10630 [Actinomycetota bacterium]|nr:hypothetical protein [Actinomycetota bacterium]